MGFGQVDMGRMKLPFLKKMPRMARDPMGEKSYGLDPAEKLEDYCIDELFDACKSQDVSSFRKALEALVLNCFDFGGDDES